MSARRCCARHLEQALQAVTRSNDAIDIRILNGFILMHGAGRDYGYPVYIPEQFQARRTAIRERIDPVQRPESAKLEAVLR